MCLRRFRLPLLSAALFGVFVAAPAVAQTSASYKLGDSVINNGGNPRSSAGLISASYHLNLDAIGDGAVRTGLQSASFRLDAGFVGGYAPPGEVQEFLLRADPLPFGNPNITYMHWHGEPSVGVYQIYRGTLGSLPGTYGTCFESNISGVSTGSADFTVPPVGQGYFYMVTARNRLGEEGPKGYRSDGTVQPNPTPCP